MYLFNPIFDVQKLANKVVITQNKLMCCTCDLSDSEKLNYESKQITDMKINNLDVHLERYICSTCRIAELEKQFSIDGDLQCSSCYIPLAVGDHKVLVEPHSQGNSYMLSFCCKDCHEKIQKESYS